jgi:hypothetical protein
VRERVVNVEHPRAADLIRHSFEKKRRREERVDEVRKASRKFVDFFGLANRHNHIGAIQLRNLLCFLQAVHHDNWIKTPAPKSVGQSHGLAKGFTIAGVNCPGDAQRSVTDVNAYSFHGQQFRTNRQVGSISPRPILAQRGPSKRTRPRAIVL